MGASGLFITGRCSKKLLLSAYPVGLQQTYMSFAIKGKAADREEKWKIRRMIGGKGIREIRLKI